MCTLTFYPVGRERFMIASSRDESREREAATLPQLQTIMDRKVLMPVDPKGGGTWIAADNNGRVACLLNGAFERHIPDPPYAKSRGKVVMDLFRYDSIDRFAEEYPLENIGPDGLSIEPFTLVMIGSHPELTAYELRWDGEHRYLQGIDVEEPQVWSSAQLYTKGIIEDTKTRFREYVDRTEGMDIERLRQFNYSERYTDKFRRAGEEPVQGVDTLSITSIFQEKTQFQHCFDDLVNGIKVRTSFPLKERTPL